MRCVVGAGAGRPAGPTTLITRGHASAAACPRQQRMQRRDLRFCNRHRAGGRPERTPQASGFRAAGTPLTTTARRVTSRQTGRSSARSAHGPNWLLTALAVTPDGAVHTAERKDLRIHLRPRTPACSNEGLFTGRDGTGIAQQDIGLRPDSCTCATPGDGLAGHPESRPRTLRRAASELGQFRSAVRPAGLHSDSHCLGVLTSGLFLTGLARGSWVRPKARRGWRAERRGAARRPSCHCW